MHKQPVGPDDPWAFSLEAGDRVYRYTDYAKKQAIMFDLLESRGWGKRTAGELTPAVVKKNGKSRIATCKDGIWYWN